MEQSHHKRLQDHTHIQGAGHTSVARLHDRIPVCSAERIPTVGACKHKKKSSGGGRVHLPGRLATRLTTYHISWHVASTFKRLTATTTHCDLNQIHQHRQGILLFHDTAHNPIRHPYNDCRIVNNQFLYRASDRKSLDFYRSY
jgi:hypothetical protein